MKKGIHPEWHPNAVVRVDGEEVMTVGSTQEQLNVEVWSGTHPFYTGEQRLLDTEGQVDRFMRRLQRRQEMQKKQEKEEKTQSPLRQNIELMGLGDRAEKALSEADITTVGDVLNLLNEGGDDALLALAGVGQKALIDIKRHLRAEGLIE
ncbi:MAG TPA: 50S ribosomal protein L31 [Anaerolineae bacterium]|nr:50S ribosomal protein L31 [Anaerolineae bacterium]